MVAAISIEHTGTFNMSETGEQWKPFSYGNFFTGQFFLEKPDLKFFRTQAQKYGFDEEAYIAAVKKVPIWAREQLENYLYFIKGLIAVISESGMKRIKEIEHRKQIQKSEKRYRSILKAAIDGYWLTDTNGRLLDDFSVWEKLTRIEDVEKSWQMMKELIEGKRERFEVEFEMRHKDGHWIHILSRSNIYKDANGERVRVVGTHVDITDSRHQRERLRLSESRYRKAQELGKVGNWEYNLKTAEFWGSDEAKKIFELDPHKDRFTIEDVESCVIERERVHQALAEKLLTEKEALFRGLFDHMTSGSAVYEVRNDGSKGTDYIIREFNRKSLEMEEKKMEEVLGRSLFDLRPNIDDYGLISDEKSMGNRHP